MEKVDKSNKESKVNKKSNNKIVIKDPIKLITFIAIFVIVIVIIVIIIASSSKKNLSEVDDYSNLNSNKYSSELLAEYEKEESKAKFLEDYETVQNAVLIYIMNNSTMESDSFTNIIKDLKSELKKDTWNLLNITKPTFWNGEYTVNDEGVVVFKFSNKNIEPSWLNIKELENKIEFNS